MGFRVGVSGFGFGSGSLVYINFPLESAICIIVVYLEGPVLIGGA